MENLGWLVIDKVLRIGLGLVLMIWLARYLGPEQFGLLNYAIAFVGLFGALASLGLQGIVVRDLVREKNIKEETLGTAAFLQFVGGALSYALIVLIIYRVRPDSPTLQLLVLVIGATILFKASDIAIYWFESQVQSKYTVWVQNTVFIVFFGVNATLILAGAPLAAFAWAMMFEVLVVAILLLVLLDRLGPGLTALTASISRAGALLSESWPLLLSGFAILVYMKIDQIMIGQILGDSSVGIYSVAVRVSEAWYFVPMAISASVFPAILDARERSHEQYDSRMQYLYGLLVWFSILVALPMTLFSAALISALFGPAYSQAGPILAIHIWAAVFVFLGVASSKWYLAEGLQILHLKRTLLGALVNVCLNYLLIPRMGAIGAAWATLLSYSIVALFADLFQKQTRRMFYMKIRALNPLLLLNRPENL